MGGENESATRAGFPSFGSSPRGRGKRRLSSLSRASTRLIPAWAGKTKKPCVPGRSRAAHPRVGGENILSRIDVSYRSGSSPRGRGKPFAPTFARAFTRLIPAWAGKTTFLYLSLPSLPAHPRVGGENFLNRATLFYGFGSSPRGRGKHSQGCHATPRFRLIPAWAGKTPKPDVSSKFSSAHPRVGGENP